MRLLRQHAVVCENGYIAWAARDTAANQHRPMTAVSDTVLSARMRREGRGRLSSTVWLLPVEAWWARLTVRCA